MSEALPANLHRAIDRLDLGSISGVTSLGGGAFRIVFASGEQLFGKTADAAPDDLYTAESEGLKAIAATRTLATPAVKACGHDHLVLEWLGGVRRDDYWETLGEQLAALHDCTRDHFGFSMDNYCGMTRQPNPSMNDGYAFFASARLEHQARLGRDTGVLDAPDARRVRLIAARLDRWIPQQPASLVHGDLWGGNIASTDSGYPALIDPAAHYGWHEAELAMTTLFRSFDNAFYDAYEHASRCHPDWRERAALYNLYHLLNHLNLFGQAYLAPVRDILSRYT